MGYDSYIFKGLPTLHQDARLSLHNRMKEKHGHDKKPDERQVAFLFGAFIENFATTKPD